MQLSGIMLLPFGRGNSNSRERIQSSGLIINTLKKMIPLIQYNVIQYRFSISAAQNTLEEGFGGSFPIYIVFVSFNQRSL